MLLAGLRTYMKTTFFNSASSETFRVRTWQISKSNFVYGNLRKIRRLVYFYQTRRGVFLKMDKLKAYVV